MKKLKMKADGGPAKAAVSSPKTWTGANQFDKYGNSADVIALRQQAAGKGISAAYNAAQAMDRTGLVSLPALIFSQDMADKASAIPFDNIELLIRKKRAAGKPFVKLAAIQNSPAGKAVGVAGRLYDAYQAYDEAGEANRLSAEADRKQAGNLSRKFTGGGPFLNPLEDAFKNNSFNQQAAPAKTNWSDLAGSAFDAVSGFADMLQTNAVNNQQRKFMTTMSSDGLYPALSADQTGSRGDYDVNTGMLRPDELGAKSPEGMYRGNYFADGGKYNAGYIADAVTLPDLPIVNAPSPVAAFKTPSMGIFGGNSTAPGFVEDANVSVGNRAKEAFDFFTREKGLPEHVAAGFVGNLNHESGLDPTIKGDGGKATGIAQWHPDRFNKLVDWAGDNGKNPYDLRTQLEYVYKEARDRGDLNKVMKTTSVDEATMVFGRTYERPSEKSAAWNSRITAARRLYTGKYQQGGQYEVSLEDLARIMAAGGEVEFV